MTTPASQIPLARQRQHAAFQNTAPAQQNTSDTVRATIPARGREKWHASSHLNGTVFGFPTGAANATLANTYGRLRGSKNQRLLVTSGPPDPRPLNGNRQTNPALFAYSLLLTSDFQVVRNNFLVASSREHACLECPAGLSHAQAVRDWRSLPSACQPLAGIGGCRTSMPWHPA